MVKLYTCLSLLALLVEIDLSKTRTAQMRRTPTMRPLRIFDLGVRDKLAAPKRACKQP